MELSKETLAKIKKSEEDIKAGRVYTLEEVKKEIGLTENENSEFDQSVQHIQKKKMKELWDNEQDSEWDEA
ncbi:hypothetical protein HOK51_08670 [Candidatus Woesearchaeota archaeon]|jgi:hypothetical protein|nr:hypothetical protein [Candidatus Woesearchaeota archaeon]MBT6519900.1 hypothetical protein [Candidatus Woesearchaeota archaeon]MBT7367124.1 hypothetical protein [Candidatus Woesearchaeota archaeon]